MIEKLKTVTEENIPKNNPTLETYFPLSTNEKKNADKAFESSAIAGQLIGFQLKKQLEVNFDAASFIDTVLEEFKESITSPEALDIIKKIYFQGDELPIITPLMYMSRPFQSLDKKTKKSLKIFLQMLQPSDTAETSSNKLNFIEKKIFEIFQKHIVAHPLVKDSHSYVRYLDSYFTQDFNYLLTNPKFFHTSIDMFLKFYFFTYSAQLALNIQEAPLQKPSLKELYFILNYEQASSERKKIVNNGYKTLIQKMRYLYPYLSLLEILSDIIEDKNFKLYDLSNIEDSTENIEAVVNFTNLLRKKRGLSANSLQFFQTLNDALKYLFESAFEQFKKSDKKAVIDRFVAAFEKQVSRPFIQSRGRFGKVLVLDQDMVLMLTNMSINTRGKLRFQDLLWEFQQRGLFFDPKSEDALLELYERVGNIERKSDSGDAVYVHTI